MAGLANTNPIVNPDIAIVHTDALPIHTVPTMDTVHIVVDNAVQLFLGTFVSVKVCKIIVLLFAELNKWIFLFIPVSLPRVCAR